MGSRLLNVRLDEDRLRKARTLRESGVALSDVVREAIDARFSALHRSMTARDATTVLERILDRYPDPVDVAPRTYDVHKAGESRAAIRRAVKRRAR
jgi:hypothetical protein